MIIAVAQPPLVSLDVAANALAHAAAVREAGARVVVFPELSLTGYELGAPSLAPDDARLAPIVRACAETGSLALVGAPVAEHIAMLAVDSAGARVAYQKIYVGAAEAERFRPGGKPSVIEVDGLRLGLAICRDTGIAQHAADTAAVGMDVYVAGAVNHAHDWSTQDSRARRVATDHNVWVAVASFAGSTGSGYDNVAGRSGIWAPGGALVAQAGSQPGEIVRAAL
ncbi:carbon-nitrogen hydrolase family protein [Allorhizocola rhizosphaerae]|uniref:carbon-nitrogen hydrolase family protein n=1 Tax=Allorhizocola rhizosphaerae TaxID=1872709 RepID=UPI000E3E6C29|nr:carbon-nitrogen hydrolase family protein [Allorhizocola rhizosphaerae]